MLVLAAGMCGWGCAAGEDAALPGLSIAGSSLDLSSLELSKCIYYTYNLQGVYFILIDIR